MGVQILNKDVSLISSIANVAKAQISNVGGIGGWVGDPTWTLSFDDIYNIGIGYGETNTQTIPENATLYFDLADENWNFGDLTVYKNGVGVFTGTVDTTISFNANDTLYIAVESANINTSMTIRQNNASGRVIATFNITVVGGGG